MKLVYINKIGQDWKGNFLYEFLFSDSISDIDGEGWDSYPSSGNPEPPEGKFIKKTGQLTTTLKFSTRIRFIRNVGCCRWDCGYVLGKYGRV